MPGIFNICNLQIIPRTHEVYPSTFFHNLVNCWSEAFQSCTNVNTQVLVLVEKMKLFSTWHHVDKTSVTLTFEIFSRQVFGMGQTWLSSSCLVCPHRWEQPVAGKSQTGKSTCVPSRPHIFPKAANPNRWDRQIFKIKFFHWHFYLKEKLCLS